MPTWGPLRNDVLDKLGFDTAEELAAEIEFEDVDLVKAALGGTSPSEAFMTALMRRYIAVPALWFVEQARNPAA